MLTDHMKPGAKILGLGKLVSSGRPAFDACYRIAPTGSGLVIEFFEKALRENVDGMYSIKILPYMTTKIAEAPVSGAEVISGEFTGCVMSLFRSERILKAGHVDTNQETTQRANYEASKAHERTLVDEYDSAGKIQLEKGHGGNTIILCIADTLKITEYFVSKTTHQSSKFTAGPGDPEKKWRQVGETMYTVLRSSP